MEDLAARVPAVPKAEDVAGRLAGFSSEDAVEICEGVYWVGHYLPDDPFQCHVYLIDAGCESVLVDPGSKLTFAWTLNKIEQVLPFSQIKYFLCHHQDPDITGALPLIDQLVGRDDAVVLTHGRAEILLRHYGLNMPFQRVEDGGWTLSVGGRMLRFVFTPYLHFPGAFCTFDERTGTLFSSDLFGGFTAGFSLFAQDESYFDAMRPFHEHYMPSREILAHGLSRLEPLGIRQIAPQHGSIIPQRLVGYMIRRLKDLDCGLYLLAERSTDIGELVRLNQALRAITETMTLHRDFATIARSLLELAQQFMPVSSLEFYAEAPGGADTILHLAPGNRFRGAQSRLPDVLAGVMGTNRQDWTDEEGEHYSLLDCWPGVGAAFETRGHPALVMPLFSPDRQVATACAILHLNHKPEGDNEVMDQVVRQMSMPLQVAVDRECLYRSLDLEREAFYEQSIRDALTGLYSRFYMQDNVKRMFDLNDRDAALPVGVLMLDLDHFKSINDRFGHGVGDEVLRRVGGTILRTVRSADIAVRLGGEEFAVFCTGRDADALMMLAERLRASIDALDWSEVLEGGHTTVSIGVATRQAKETLPQLLARADAALYLAKHAGRNRVVGAGGGEETP